MRLCLPLKEIPMKKNYKTAEMILIFLESKDVITASGDSADSKYVELEPDYD